MSFKIAMGAKVKDVITGLVGTVTSRTEWITGCNSYGIQPKEIKDGRPVESSGIDETRLEVVGKPTFKNTTPDSGGPHDFPKMSR